MPPEKLIGHGLLGEDDLIDAGDGRLLRTMTAGQGEDLVVLEAGLGASGLYWGPVHALLAGSCRVLAYERAGFGASTPIDGHSRGIEALADDLEAVISSVQHRRLVLVRHSWGGPVVHLLAARFASRGEAPDGVVLVDPSDEFAIELYTGRSGRISDAIKDATLVGSGVG